jgi:acetyl/propionyl-CoA carboxylase alpha subunit
VFKKILIANRGEIACRVMRTARRMGIHSVAVFAEADRDALHVKSADEAQRIEGYLDIASILSAARASGAEAIHPGYGFLAENEDFAAACGEAGIVFIGPTPEAIAAMGDKSAAKRLMEKAKVPLVPGYHGENQDVAFLEKEAARVGFPVLIKPSAGGGGKGDADCPGAKVVSREPRRRKARSEIGVRRRARADRALPRAAAAHRDAGVRRCARQCRAPLRARLLGAAPSPESAGRSTCPWF